MTQQILTRKACEFLMQTRFRAFCLTPKTPTRGSLHFARLDGQ